MGLYLVWCYRLICIVLSLCKHACKDVCDANQGIDPYLLPARSCDRWWPDFVTLTACKRSIFGLKRGKKAQCVSIHLFKRKTYFEVRCTLKYGTVLAMRSNVQAGLVQSRSVTFPFCFLRIVTFCLLALRNTCCGNARFAIRGASQVGSEYAAWYSERVTLQLIQIDP